MASLKTSSLHARKEPKSEGSATQVQSAEAAKPAPTAPNKKVKSKHKLVRDSFTIPKNEYALLDDLKQRSTRLTRPAKKSEILRAGIGALNAMSDKAFLAALGLVPSLTTGRPKLAEASAELVTTKKVRAVAQKAVQAED